VAEESFSALYKGLPPKAVHVIINNYLYFYVYEWLKAKRAALKYKSSTLLNTACGVIAGVANLTVTLPLDTMVVRVQAEGPDGRGVAEHASALLAEGPSGMWRGMGISSILTLNPALTFAVFDAIKARFTKAVGGSRHLGAAQAFLIGSIAKVIATVLTYPLIRAKTMMQAQSGARSAASAQQQHHQQQQNGTCSHGASNGATHGIANGGIVAKAPPGFVEILLKIWREEGLNGLYTGCGAQIFTAICKSGILLAAKEKISAAAIALLIVMGHRQRKALK
jgi:hypothetical protein